MPFSEQTKCLLYPHMPFRFTYMSLERRAHTWTHVPSPLSWPQSRTGNSVMYDAFYTLLPTLWPASCVTRDCSQARCPGGQGVDVLGEVHSVKGQNTDTQDTFQPNKQEPWAPEQAFLFLTPEGRAVKWDLQLKKCRFTDPSGLQGCVWHPQLSQN